MNFLRFTLRSSVFVLIAFILSFNLFADEITGSSRITAQEAVKLAMADPLKLWFEEKLNIGTGELLNHCVFKNNEVMVIVGYCKPDKPLYEHGADVFIISPKQKVSILILIDLVNDAINGKYIRPEGVNVDYFNLEKVGLNLSLDMDKNAVIDWIDSYFQLVYNESVYTDTSDDHFSVPYSISDVIIRAGHYHGQSAQIERTPKKFRDLSNFYISPPKEWFDLLRYTRDYMDKKNNAQDE